MGNFNNRVVDSLDLINRVLAGVFVVVAILAFVEVAGESFVGGLLAFLTAITTGIITCGYIALMLNINDNLQVLRDKIAGPRREDDQW